MPVETEVLDPARCYRARCARDRRFDGVFYVGVKTTGIYCRPICPVKVPGESRCTFYRHAALAEAAGYRACFRCRPELAPGHASVDARSRLATQVVRELDRGALDGGESTLEELAARLGVTSRHLRRSFEAEVGVSPVAYAQTRRLALAKQLLQDTELPLAQVAFAAGFGSVRRFNAVFAASCGRPPSSIRRGKPAKTARRSSADDGDQLRVRLDLRPPYDWEHLLEFLETHAIPGVERVELVGTGRAGRYQHTFAFAGGIITVTRENETSLSVSLPRSLALTGEVMNLTRRLRALFDLDAHPERISAQLSLDPRIAPSLSARPGMRVPGGFDGFELAVRTILGQQVSVRGGSTLAGRFVSAFGEKLVRPIEDGPLPLTHVFPAPEALAARDPEEVAKIVGMPIPRGKAIVALARGVVDGRIDLSPGADAAELEAALLELPGVGPWTSAAIVMRGARCPDAFPAGDLVLKKRLGVDNEKAVTAWAEAHRPFRSYAAMHLWASLTPELPSPSSSKKARASK